QANTKQFINRFLAFTCDDQPPFYKAALFVLAEADGPVRCFLAFTCYHQPLFYQATLFVLAKADGPVLLPTLIVFVTIEDASI
ncbi:hypothetical protein RDWZM_005040, partial [Blomia tropicalis]